MKIKQGLNVITGSNGSGKTRALKLICQSNKCLSETEFLYSLASGDKTLLSYQGIIRLIANKYPQFCLLTDDLFAKLDEQKRRLLAKDIKESKIKLITTSSNEHYMKEIGANIINVGEIIN